MEMEKFFPNYLNNSLSVAAVGPINQHCLRRPQSLVSPASQPASQPVLLARTKDQTSCSGWDQLAWPRRLPAWPAKGPGSFLGVKITSVKFTGARLNELVEKCDLPPRESRSLRFSTASTATCLWLAVRIYQ